jgi:hypothetical protein
MCNGLLALCQLSPQPAPLELGGCQDSSLDPVKDGLHAAEGVVVTEVELRRRFVALLDGREAAVPPVLYLPLRRVLTSARYLPWEVLEDHCLGVGILLSHVPVLLGSYLRRDLLGAVHRVVETSRYWNALGNISHGPRQINLEPRSVNVVKSILAARCQSLELVA